MTKELIQKLRDGDSVTNDELCELHIYYTKLEEDTKLLGKMFHLMWVEIYYSKCRIEGYMRARGMKMDEPF